MEKKLDLSPNYSKKSRNLSKIKFVIIHYTGMQSEIESIKRLKNPQSKVSCHYLISRNGLITQMVLENKIAWHAGKSKWKKFKNLNNVSIGIELVNKGHNFGYQKFAEKQIKSLIRLCIFLKKKYNIKKENFLGHSDIAPLRKRDPGENFPWKRMSKFNLGIWYKKSNYSFPKKNNYELFFFRNLYKIGYRYFSIGIKKRNNIKLIKIFQQKYIPKNISGKIDQKTLQISDFLANY